MDKEETERNFCSCKSTCKMRTVKNGNRGCPCKTAGDKCGNKCTCGTAKLSCQNTEVWKKTPKVEPGVASARQMPYDSNNNFSEAFRDPRNRKEEKEDKEEGAAYKPFKFEEDSEGAGNILRYSISSIKQEQNAPIKRPASKALTKEVKDEDDEEEAAYKRSRIDEDSGNENDNEGIASISHCNISPIKPELVPVKREASEALTREASDAAAWETYEEDESTLKRIKSTEASESQSESEDLDEQRINREVVFAIDSSWDISKEQLQKQINFVKYMAKALTATPGKFRAALITYGDVCQTLIPLDKDDFSVQLNKLATEPKFHGKGRRIDLALTTAAKIFNSANRSSSGKQFQEEKDKLVILTTAGIQSWNDPRQQNPDALSSVAEKLQMENVKVIIVSVGSGINLEELVQVIERPQYLFPLSSFSDLVETKAQKIAEEILETADIVKYTERKVISFPGVSENPDCGLGEKISECLDVMEGAWNLLYRPKNYRHGARAKKVVGPARKRIQEGLNDFHSRLVLDSNITINIAVFGTEGAGKSTLINFLLNGDVQGNLLNEGPLPAGKGTRQTRLPIYVKYANSLQVLLHKDRDELKAVVLFPNSELKLEGGTSFTILRSLLKRIFDQEDVLEDATHIELQGPFSIFNYLQERRITSSGHLELELDVKLVDLPGLREDQKGDKVLISELSKADMILFFTSGQEGREVTPHDLANVFRQHGKFDFPSRPKLIHIVKASASDDFEKMLRKNQEVLEKVWKEFFEDAEGNKCYKMAREKLPSLGGEDLLKKLQEESEVLVFHPGNEKFLPGLKDALSKHIENVKTKKSFHPSLKVLHRLAKDLNKTISSSASRANKVPQDFHKVTVDKQLPFEITPDEKEIEDLIQSFFAGEYEVILEQENIEGV